MSYYFYYTDSIDGLWKIEYTIHEYLNVMTLIFDRGYEDWGDCKGRAWCGSCHIQVATSTEANLEADEKHTLFLLPNQTKESRLACQIPLDRNLHQKHLRFLGDFDA